MSIMVETLNAFGAAMAEAEKHRTILKKRFGLTDQPRRAKGCISG
jgi:hypothetical protein